MDKIFDAMLIGVCAKEAGQLWLWSDFQILVTRCDIRFSRTISTLALGAVHKVRHAIFSQF